MSDGPVDDRYSQLLERAAQAWNENDVEAMLALFAPDFEMELAGAFLGLKHRYVGPDEYREFWSEFQGMWKTIEVTIEGLEQFGEAVVLADIRFSGVGREDLPVDMTFFAVLRIISERATLWLNFVERDPAVEAARSVAELTAANGV